LSFCLAYAMLRMAILYSNERRARRFPACRTDIAGFTMPQLDVTSRVDNCQVGVFTETLGFSPRKHRGFIPRCKRFHGVSQRVFSSHRLYNTRYTFLNTICL